MRRPYYRRIAHDKAGASVRGAPDHFSMTIRHCRGASAAAGSETPTTA